MSRKHRRKQKQQTAAPPPPDPPKPSPGRKTVLTPEVQAVIVEAARRGTPLTFCAPLAGVARSSLFLWLKKGQAADTPYTAFSDAVKAAQAEFVGDCLAEIARQGNDSWQAKAWLLERMFREEFASNQLEINQIKKEVKDLKQLLAKVPRDAGEEAAARGPETPGGGDGPADGPAPAA